MVLFGLVIVLLGVGILLAGLFSSGYDAEGSSITNELLQINMSSEVLFLFGVASGALMVLGLWIMKRGAQQGMKHRKEQRKIGELSEKLEAAERRAEDDNA